MKKYLVYSMLIAAVTLLSFRFNIVTEASYTIKDFMNYKIEKESESDKAEFDRPDEALRWYFQQRAYPNNFIPDNWQTEAYKHIKLHNTSEAYAPNALSWTQLGPGNIGGRIRAIAVHPTDPNIVYIGAVAGGVWKTTNGGTSWTALHDFMENLAVCSIVIDPNNPNTIYAGTGEGFFNLDAIRGMGIFKSTNAGANWTQLSSTNNENFYYVNDLDFDAANGVLYAATRKGLYASNNGGTSFSPKLTGSGADVNCMDIEIALTSPRTIYATFGLFSQSEIWRSTDAGSTFQQHLSLSNTGRIEMAASLSNPQVVYASFMSLSHYGTESVVVTTNGGSNWYYVAVPGPSYAGQATYTGTQGWYDNILAVDPTNEAVLFAGGIDNWKSTDYGQNWTQKTNWYTQTGAPPYAHADQHAMAFAPSNPNIVYLGNDGGIYKSTDKGETWTAMNNNLFISQFYYGAVNPTGTVYAGGLQDNGTIRTTGTTNWYEILGGDGGATEIDFNNPNNIYMEYVNLAFYKSTDGGASFQKKMNGIPAGSGLYDGTTDRTQFISPFSMDPNNSNTIVAGTYRVWRTTNGADNWTAISGDLTGDGSGTSGNTISTVIVAKGNSSVIYAGCSNGRVQVTTNAGTNWNLRNSGLPNLAVTKIATDPNDPATAYVTFSGFVGGEKIYKTTNYGANWSNVSGNLPNIPANCVLVNPANSSNIFIGTDLGVFSTTNGGTSWVQDANGMANVPVFDLDYRSSDNKIFAATHGRSMYSAALSGGGGGVQTANLVYDDGSPYSGYYWPNSGQGSANRMTPTLTNATLTQMEIYFTGVSQGTATYKPIVLGNSGGTPGSDLVSLNFKTAASYPGWDATNLSSYGITVNTDFYVGLKYDGTNRPLFGFDQSNNGRAWDFDGTNWASWSETYFMRATIQTTTSIAQITNVIPDKFELTYNYPNPFNPTTKFKYALPEGKDVSIIIYDITGKKVTELVNNYQAAGTYEVTWNGKNDAGNQVASGTYIYSVKAGSFTQSKKMVLLR